MAEILWTPDGGVELSGCACVFHTETIPLKFGNGDIAFLRSRAVKGVLERVAIQRAGVRTDAGHSCSNPLINYFDTFNARYMEDELVTHAEAIALATTYLENQIAALENLEVCK
jgi:hypothetical protein